jgi:hypothetical protein
VWQYNTTQLDPNWSKEGYYFSWRERLVDEVKSERRRKKKNETRKRITIRTRIRIRKKKE